MTCRSDATQASTLSMLVEDAKAGHDKRQREANLAKAFRDIEYQLNDAVGMIRVVSRLHEAFEAELIAAKQAHGFSGPQLVEHFAEWREDLAFAIRMAHEEANELRRAYDSAA